MIDRLSIEWGSELWKTATVHMFAMLTATVVFLIAALAGHGGYVDQVTNGAFILTLIGFGFLTLGGWLGGWSSRVRPRHAHAQPGQRIKRASRRSRPASRVGTAEGS